MMKVILKDINLRLTYKLIDWYGSKAAHVHRKISTLSGYPGIGRDTFPNTGFSL